MTSPQDQISHDGWILPHSKRELLREFLSYAVPIEIIRLHQECRPYPCDWAWIETAYFADDKADKETFDRRDEIDRAGVKFDGLNNSFDRFFRGVSVYLASKGDCVAHFSEGDTRKVFARIAKTIAIFSFHPSGFRIFDTHWKAADYWQHRSCDCGEIDGDRIPGCEWTIADLPKLQALR